ncbi:response regulator transcription factor [Enterococcus sp. BWM-S5]|uniref:Response regulator transcription factor n=1 Tax=Enterococcus larvae TaxID=2794352 RepID=A0ABS4CFY2_9ENTE|nr:response regulator transcription factor [Enterococcus larvae]MBP1045540.1 response regulator transcription factor [Enterococcus larvae]
MKKILLIEDDEHLRRGISFTLEQEGYSIVSHDQVGGALDILKQVQPHLVILDVNLPDGNGLDLCTQIRKISQVPLFFLTALDMETDVVAGLSVGGDDYITKPFSLAILKAKVAAVFRREESYTQKIISPPFTLNIERNCLLKNDAEILLSATEYRIVSYFIKNRGIVLEKEKILSVLWDEQGKYIDENTLSVNIRRIRLKIEDDPQTPRYIKTVRGVGYIWEKEE